MNSESSCDTNQVSVGDCGGWVRLKVLVGGHFCWSLTVTQDGQEAEQQHPVEERPRAVHGAGGWGCQEETKYLGVAVGLQESLPEPLLSYRDQPLPAHRGHGWMNIMLVESLGLKRTEVETKIVWYLSWYYLEIILWKDLTSRKTCCYQSLKADGMIIIIMKWIYVALVEE